MKAIKTPRIVKVIGCIIKQWSIIRLHTLGLKMFGSRNPPNFLVDHRHMVVYYTKCTPLKGLVQITRFHPYWHAWHLGNFELFIFCISTTFVRALVFIMAATIWTIELSNVLSLCYQLLASLPLGVHGDTP
jgi:hypothetical protein